MYFEGLGSSSVRCRGSCTYRVVPTTEFILLVSFSALAYLKVGASLGFCSRVRPAAAAAAKGLEVRCADYDYDLVIIGAGVGGHGAALHAVECGLKTAIIEGGDVGGTCVNRGCVPSKALLAASGRVRDMKNADHLKMLGIEVRPG